MILWESLISTNKSFIFSIEKFKNFLGKKLGVKRVQEKGGENKLQESVDLNSVQKSYVL